MSIVTDHRSVPRRFLWVTGCILLTVIALDLINGRLWMSDFRVYWEASGRFLQGEAPYGEAFGLTSGLYKYSPFTLLLFAPWSWLPYGIASFLFALVIATASVFGMVRCERVVRERLIGAAPIREVILWCALLATVVHLHRELHLGNVNMLLLVLLVVSAERMLHGAALQAGALLGVVILVKPHFIVLMPLLLLHARYREGLIALGTIAIGILLPAVVVGWKANLALHAAWLQAMIAHNASPFYTGEGSKMATDTVYSVLWQLSGGTLPATATSAWVVLALIAIGVLVFDRWNDRRHRDEVGKQDGDLLFAFLLLIALVPSITPTDTEHFLLALPMVIFLLHQMFRHGHPVWLPPAGIAILLLLGGNWQDLWGPWSGVLADHGVLGAANVLLIGLCAFLYARKDKRTATA